MIYRIGRATRNIIIAGVLLTALALTGIRLLLPEINAYRSELEAKVGEVLGTPVKIGRLRAHLSGFRPELILADIRVTAVSGSEPAIRLQEIHLEVDLLESILSRRFLSVMQVTLVGAKLGVMRNADGSLAVTGLKNGGAPPLWLLQGRDYRVLHSEVTWRSEKDDAPPLVFSDVDILIANHYADNRRQIHVLLDLPHALGHTLRLSLDTTGNIFAPGGINGRLFAAGEGIKPAGWSAAHLPGNFKAVAGTVDFKLWSDWHQSRMTTLWGDMRLKDAKLLGVAHDALDVKALATLFHWRRGEDNWQLQVKDLLVDAGALQWRNETFSVQAVSAGSDNRVRRIGGYIPHLNVADFCRLALFFAQREVFPEHLLQQLNPVGTLRNVAFYLEPDEQRYAVRGEFEQLGWSAAGRIPAVRKLSGTLKGSEQGGIIRLDTQNGQIDFTDVFRATLPLSRLTGVVHWRQTLQQWELSGPALELDTPDFETINRFSLRIPKGSEPVFIDLQTAFGNLKNVAQAVKYLPSKIMDADLVAWLDHALVGGRVESGAVLLHGLLNDYPFAGHQGVFEALFTAQELELNMHPQWPNVKGITADVQFFQDALQADIRSGESEGLHVEHATASIASLENSDHVRLKGMVRGTLQKGMEYLRKTPLRATVDPALEFIAPRGTSDVDLDLLIALTASAADKVDGTVHLQNAELTVLPPNIGVRAIQGELRFNEQGIAAENLTARVFGSKVAADIFQSGEQTVVRLDGRLAANKLAALFPSPYWRALQGQTDYLLRLVFPAAGGQPAGFEFSSDLQGLAVDLPGALRKTVQQPRLLRAECGFSEDTLMPVLVHYGDELQAAISIDKRNGKLFSADVLLTQSGRKERAEFSVQPGITVGVKRASFDIDPWFETVQQQGSHASIPDMLRKINIETPRLRWQNTDLGPLALDLQRLGGRWQGTIDSRFASGNISAPQRFSHTEKLVLDLQTLNLAPFAAMQLQGEASLSPLQLPALQINSRKVLWRSVDLGALNLRADATANGLDFKTLELRAADQKVQLSGRWQAGGKQSFSEAKGVWRSDALGKFLAQADILQDVQDTPAQIDFTLHWTGAPYQASFSNLQGIADVRLGEGRVQGIDPGIGRVLGILALDQWKRRLQLDFSDAYAEGLTYNRITGRFELAGGYAYTDNLVIEAVPARIEIKGKTGLVSRDWDQLVIVTPKTSAALPIAGTIAGKLITGAASLLAEPSVVEELTHFASSAYTVKGIWGAADIMPLHESDGLLRKVWTGMTDFSWLQ
ncbi:MAG: YhdP family protein [Gammaproteobacteria bacterium]